MAEELDDELFSDAIYDEAGILKHNIRTVGTGTVTGRFTSPFAIWEDIVGTVLEFPEFHYRPEPDPITFEVEIPQIPSISDVRNAANRVEQYRMMRERTRSNVNIPERGR